MDIQNDKNRLGTVNDRKRVRGKGKKVTGINQKINGNQVFYKEKIIPKYNTVSKTFSLYKI